MDVGHASTSFHYAQAAHKKERCRKLGHVNSTDPRTIRQISFQNSPRTPILIDPQIGIEPSPKRNSPAFPFFI